MGDTQMKHQRLLLLLLMAILLILITAWLSGCFYARVDYDYKDDFSQDKTRVSATVWTIGKSYYLDPNSIISESDKIKFIYPPIGLETE